MQLRLDIPRLLLIDVAAAQRSHPISRAQAPLKPESVQFINPLDSKAALFASIVNLLRSSLVVHPLTKMRNVARDSTVVVDGVVLHQFIKGFVPLVLIGKFPRELD